MTYPPPGQSPYEPQPPAAGQPAGIPAPPPGYQPYPGYPPPGAAYPPPPGYGPPPGYPYPVYPPPFGAGDAFGWAWAQFRKRMGLLIGVPLAWFAAVVAVLVPFIVVSASLGPQTTTDAGGKVTQQEPASPAFVVTMVLLFVVIFGLAFLMSNCLMAAQLDIADGKPITFGSFFKPRRFGAYVAVSLLVLLLTIVGGVACIVPGIIVGFLGQYATYFVVDRGLGAVAAIKASFKLMRDNLGIAILTYLIVMAAGLVTEFAIALTFGLGIFVFLPAMVSVVGLMHVAVYRRLSGGLLAA